MPIPLREERDFRLDVNELKSLITDRTKLIIINSPQNPTGGVLTKSDIDDIAAAIGDRDIMVLSDEIYGRLIFEGEQFSISAMEGMKERTIILDGFSKTYAMTGWRMGYGVMRADLATHIARLMTNSNSCTASFTQIAGVEAIRGDQTRPEHMRLEFEKRRDVFVNGINQIKGFSCRLPKGAFYTFPNITQTGWPSKKLADALLEEAGVAGLSGTAFGGLAKAICASASPTPWRTCRSAGPHRPVDEEEPVECCGALARQRAGRFSVGYDGQQTPDVRADRHSLSHFCHRRHWRRRFREATQRGYEVEVYPNSEPPSKSLISRKLAAASMGLSARYATRSTKKFSPRERARCECVAQYAVGVDNIDRADGQPLQNPVHEYA